MQLKTVLGAAAILCASASGGAAAADPWKDESGHGRDRGYYDHDRRDRGYYDPDRRDYGRYDRGARFGGGVPRGHLPPPGLCRVWIDGRPPGQQPPPVSCARAERIAARRGDADVVDHRGRRWAGDERPRGWSRSYEYDRGGGYQYERVCRDYDERGACIVRPRY